MCNLTLFDPGYLPLNMSLFLTIKSNPAPTETPHERLSEWFQALKMFLFLVASTVSSLPALCCLQER